MTEQSEISDFVLGFIAGEGSFSVSFQEQTTYEVNVYPNFRFYMGVNDWDEEVMEHIYEEIGVGDLIYRSGNGKREDQVVIEVRRIDEVEEFIGWIDENASKTFKMTDKYESYISWRDAFRIREDAMRDPDKMLELIDTAKEINGSTKGYSAEHWKQKINQKT